MGRLLKRHNIILLTVILTNLVLTRSILVVAHPLPINEYWQKVEETQALVQSLGSASPETRRNKLDAAADGWEAITSALLSDGTTVPLDHSFIAARMRADPPDLDQLNTLLTNLLESRDTWPQREVAPADMQALDRILARPEFQWPPKQPSPLEEWWQELQRRFLEFIANLVPAEVLPVLAPLLSYALPGLGALALILVLAYAMRSLLADFVVDKETDAENGREKDLTAAAALKRAQALSAGGDYRTAVRYLYLSTLLLLEERGLLRYDRSMTNREYLRSLAHKPELAAIFRDVTEIFDRAWYGYRQLDEKAYTWYADRVKELQRQQ
ncbi:MAG: DUF4129 domain-containing protein [Anaerolineae bacterium]|nr:DUF4129 domain-containing protein [Anaerolineae bacterium]